MYSKRDMKKQEAEWRAESDLRTLQECRKIEKDPARLKAAQEYARKKLADAKEAIGEIEEELAEGKAS